MPLWERLENSLLYLTPVKLRFYAFAVNLKNDDYQSVFPG